MRDSQVIVGRGRELAYTDIGDPGGACVFFSHGAPLSRLHLIGLEDQFAAEGLRVLSLIPGAIFRTHQDTVTSRSCPSCR